jgi:hypothetical protein
MVQNFAAQAAAKAAGRPFGQSTRWPAILVKGAIFQYQKDLKHIGGHYDKALDGFVFPKALRQQVGAFLCGRNLYVEPAAVAYDPSKPEGV